MAKTMVKTAARLIQGFMALRVGVMPDWVRLRRAAWGSGAESAVFDEAFPEVAGFVASHLELTSDL